MQFNEMYGPNLIIINFGKNSSKSMQKFQNWFSIVLQTQRRLILLCKLRQIKHILEILHFGAFIFIGDSSRAKNDITSTEKE